MKAESGKRQDDRMNHHDTTFTTKDTKDTKNNGKQVV